MKVRNGMCEQCESFESEMLAIANDTDPEFGDGSKPNSWLSWEPKVSDAQLSVFERLLSLFRKQLEHAGNGPRAFAMLEANPLPANVALVLIRELQVRRSAETVTVELPDNLTVDQMARSWLPIDRHGKTPYEDGSQ
jgi:hypothetical protein